MIFFLQLLTTCIALTFHQQLYEVISNDLDKNPEKIPQLVRASFHDLMNYNPATGNGGPFGCILEQKMRQNVELEGPMADLQQLVNSTFSPGQFTFGDVISLAGKAAIEKALPCMKRVKWRPGRHACNAKEKEEGPFGTIDRLGGLNAFLRRYGLNATEMAILLAGAHGLKGAKMQTNGNMPMAYTNSGKDWIKQTINTVWVYFNRKENPAFKGDGVIRLRVDMMFFPSVVQESTSADNGPMPFVDLKAAEIEEEITKYAYGTDQEFNDRFSEVYSRMLEIGAFNLSSTWYEDLPLPALCASDS